MTLDRIAPALCLTALIAAPAAAMTICETTALLERKSASFERLGELKHNLAVCLNLTDPAERTECRIEAFIEFGEAHGLIQEQYAARLELCDLLDEDAYDPEIDPDNFTTEIDNEHLPLPFGAEWVYESETEEGEIETIVVTVLPESETREILGVECISVRDVVSIDGEPVEDTIDWYAQDRLGNVWYFGEISFSFEDGFVENIDGSWLSGVDGAKPGIVMLGEPVPGTTYRQEWLLGEAEDAGTVLEDDVSVTIDLGTFDHCVKTADFLPPEPDALEFKYYAPGIGFIYETKADSDETVELISTSGL